MRHWFAALKRWWSPRPTAPAPGNPASPRYIETFLRDAAERMNFILLHRRHHFEAVKFVKELREILDHVDDRGRPTIPLCWRSPTAAAGFAIHLAVFSVFSPPPLDISSPQGSKPICETTPLPE